MPFSFTPAEEHSKVAPVPQATSNNGIPALVVPTIPTISTVQQVEEKISPFAYKNRNKSKFGIYFQAVVFLVFGGMVITAIGLFAYQGILKKEIENKQFELADAQRNFPKLNLEEMQKLSKRLVLVNKVFKEHASVRTAFQLLEHSVENPVTFTKFDLVQNKDKKGYTLSLSAEASNYFTGYQQIQALESKTYASYISGFKVTDINLDKKGFIIFKINTNIALEGILPESATFSTSTSVTSSENNNEIISKIQSASTSSVTQTP